ncbi:hypothetical protein [Polaribacter sp. Q13]|uniref:hypothetical protein n=1 Tax=Polaribacter sp. Q13 TaxID=2806551 RepID=UPI00193C613F|nr:hypothetical protein [Polaribacter sp. Q13]QVY66862.1 hypothetical protein JOP69_06155 [Polaribacter sp. Q13]
MVSEIYHIFVLKSAKSIKSNSKINYEITKATSYGIAFIFGYFYKPFFVVLWMIVFIFIFAFIYMGLFNLNFENAIFNSGFTFLTIGFLENNETRTLLETTLMLSEGIIGITYTATLLTSIINSTRKQ